MPEFLGMTAAYLLTIFGIVGLVVVVATSGQPTTRRWIIVIASAVLASAVLVATANPRFGVTRGDIFPNALVSLLLSYIVVAGLIDAVRWLLRRSAGQD